MSLAVLPVRDRVRVLDGWQTEVYLLCAGAGRGVL